MSQTGAASGVQSQINQLAQTMGNINATMTSLGAQQNNTEHLADKNRDDIADARQRLGVVEGDVSTLKADSSALKAQTAANAAGVAAAAKATDVDALKGAVGSLEGATSQLEQQVHSVSQESAAATARVQALAQDVQRLDDEEDRVVGAFQSEVERLPGGGVAPNFIVGGVGNKVGSQAVRTGLVNCDSVSVDRAVTNALVLNSRGDVPMDDNTTTLVSLPVGTEGSTARASAGVLVSNWSELTSEEMQANSSAAFEALELDVVEEGPLCGDSSSAGVNVAASFYKLNGGLVQLPKVDGQAFAQASATGTKIAPYQNQLISGNIAPVSAFVPKLLQDGTFSTSKQFFKGARSKDGTVDETLISGNTRLAGAGRNATMYTNREGALAFSGISGQERVQFEVASVRLHPRNADNTALEADDTEDDVLRPTVGTLASWTSKRVVHSAAGAVADTMDSTLISGKQLDTLRAYLLSAMSGYEHPPGSGDIDNFIDNTFGIGPPLYPLAFRAFLPQRLIEPMALSDISVNTSNVASALHAKQFVERAAAGIRPGGFYTIPFNADDARSVAVWTVLADAPYETAAANLTHFDGTAVSSEDLPAVINGEQLVRQPFIAGRVRAEIDTVVYTPDDTDVLQNVGSEWVRRILVGSAPTDLFRGFHAPNSGVVDATNTTLSELSTISGVRNILGEYRFAAAQTKAAALGEIAAASDVDMDASQSALSDALAEMDTAINDAFNDLKGVDLETTPLYNGLDAFLDAIKAAYDAFVAEKVVIYKTAGTTPIVLSSTTLDGLKAVLDTRRAAIGTAINKGSVLKVNGLWNAKSLGSGDASDLSGITETDIDFSQVVQQMLVLYRESFALTEEYTKDSNAAPLTAYGLRLMQGIEYALNVYTADEAGKTIALGDVFVKDGSLQACFSTQYEITNANVWDGTVNTHTNGLTEGQLLNGFITRLNEYARVAELGGSLVKMADEYRHSTGTTGSLAVIPFTVEKYVDLRQAGTPQVITVTVSQATTTDAASIELDDPSGGGSLDETSLQFHPGMDAFEATFGLPYIATEGSKLDEAYIGLQNSTGKKYVSFDEAKGHMVLNEDVTALNSAGWVLSRRAFRPVTTRIGGRMQTITPALTTEHAGDGAIVYTTHAQLAARPSDDEFAKPATILVRDSPSAQPHEDIVYTYCILPSLRFGACNSRRTFRSNDNITLRGGVRGLVNLRMTFGHVGRASNTGAGDLETGMVMDAMVRLAPGKAPEVVTQRMTQVAFNGMADIPTRFLIDGTGDSSAGWEFLAEAAKVPPVGTNGRFTVKSSVPNASTQSRTITAHELQSWLVRAVRNDERDASSQVSMPAALAVEAVPRGDGMQELAFVLRVASAGTAARVPTAFGGMFDRDDVNLVSVCDYHTIALIPGALPPAAASDSLFDLQEAVQGPSDCSEYQYLRIKKGCNPITVVKSPCCPSGVGASGPTRAALANATQNPTFGGILSSKKVSARLV